MTGRAQALVFWPGITSDIARTRNNCGKCDTIAPSQPTTNAVPPEIPSYPFEMVCSDYFDLEGTHYLVIEQDRTEKKRLSYRSSG